MNWDFCWGGGGLHLAIFVTEAVHLGLGHQEAAGHVGAHVGLFLHHL